MSVLIDSCDLHVIHFVNSYHREPIIINNIFMISVSEIKNKIGLAEKEARVYFALLKEGSGFASNIATVAGIKRSTAYQVLERLHEYGLVLKYQKGKKYFFAPAKPRSILTFLEGQEREVQERKTQFKDMLPELNVYFANKQKKPKLVFFDRESEIKRLVFDALQPRGQKEVIGFFSLDQLLSHITNGFFKEVAETIKQHKMPLKLINYDEEQSAEKNTRLWLTKHFASLPKELQPKVKIINEKSEMTSMILIAAHKTYLIDLTPPELMGTVISNQDMATGISIIFNNLWSKIK